MIVHIHVTHCCICHLLFLPIILIVVVVRVLDATQIGIAHATDIVLIIGNWIVTMLLLLSIGVRLLRVLHLVVACHLLLLLLLLIHVLLVVLLLLELDIYELLYIAYCSLLLLSSVGWVLTHGGVRAPHIEPWLVFYLPADHLRLLLRLIDFWAPNHSHPILVLIEVGYPIQILLVLLLREGTFLTGFGIVEDLCLVLAIWHEHELVAWSSSHGVPLKVGLGKLSPC